MFAKRLCVSLVSASLIVIPVQRASAGDEAAALLGGLLLGGIIVNEVNKNKQRQQTTTTTRQAAPRHTGPSSAQREQSRQVQSALNYFGYNVGAVDGVVGRKTRAGIARYQADMGFQPDGRMDEAEREFLVGSHQRALASANVPPYNSILATQGQAGLLRTYRNEQLGIPTQPVATTAVAPAPAPAPAPVEPKTVPARAQTATLPDFTFGKASRSVNEFCNEINVLTAANGGITTSGRVTDAEFALNEQFCLARTHAMAESTRIEATIPNMTGDQIVAQCSGLTQVIAPRLASIGTARPDQIIADTGGFLQGSGQPMDQLISGGKVCLGVGYRTDNAEMALASAVLLASAGQLGYGEVVSHHMREGFGTARVPAPKSAEWMTLALQSLAGGGAPVLGQSADRVAVLNAAISGAGQSNAALPVFPSASGD